MPSKQKLGDDLTRVSWEGHTVRGKNTDHLLAECTALYDMSTRQLGKLFNVSHETIRQHLLKFAENYPDDWAIIEAKTRYYDHFKELYEAHDGNLVEIANELQITLNKARSLQNTLIPREDRIKQISLTNRQRSICFSLFGFEYAPGDNFEEELIEWLKHQDSTIRNRLTDYYIKGANVPKDARYDRFKDLRVLEAWLKENIQMTDLIDKEVICPNRKL